MGFDSWSLMPASREILMVSVIMSGRRDRVVDRVRKRARACVADEIWIVR
jgi:hypothetical protein